MGGAEFWSLKPALLSSDPAPVKARRRLAQLIAAEQEAASASSHPDRLAQAVPQL